MVFTRLLQCLSVNRLEVHMNSMRFNRRHFLTKTASGSLAIGAAGAAGMALIAAAKSARTLIHRFFAERSISAARRQPPLHYLLNYL